MQKVYLSRRNLQTLLNKLDRNVAAQDKVSKCTITKFDTLHSVYPCTDIIEVTALEDDEYYTDRAPGRVHDADTPSTPAEYRVQVQSFTGKWRDSINENVKNPYYSFYEATKVAEEQNKNTKAGLKYKVAVTLPPTKKYQVEYYSELDQKWCRSINHGSQNPFNTSAEAKKALLDAERKNTIGFLYRVVEVDS